MTRHIVPRSAFAFVVTLLLSATAEAQLFRAYLAPDGLDANPCTLAAPCRLLPAALAAVADGGEIWMLDSANYNTGPVNVAKSVSILAVPGAVGSIVALGGPGITITTGGLTVSLRNVLMGPVAGAAAGTNAIHVLTTGSRVIVEKSVITGMGSDGILVTGVNSLTVIDSTIRKSGGYAISLTEGARATITGARMLDNVWGGVHAFGQTGVLVTSATMSDSLVAGGEYGVFAYANINATTRVSVARTTFERTGKAVLSSSDASGIAEVNVGRSVFAFNNNSWQVFGAATFYSMGNSTIQDNGAGIGTKQPMAGQ